MSSSGSVRLNNQRIMGGQIAFVDFLHSAANDSTPPAGLTGALQSLWFDHREQWAVAHNLAQEAGGNDGAWVHAYLHRKEGDEANAAYWYRLASKPIASNSLPAEWEQIARALLAGTD